MPSNNNSAPVIVIGPGDTVGALLPEDPANINTITGAFGFTDANTLDTHIIGRTYVPSLSSGNSPVGTLTIQLIADSTGGLEGEIGWTYKATGVKRDFLAQGQTYIETFRINIGDNFGGITPQDIVITLTGSNDAPRFVTGPNSTTAATVIPQVGTADVLTTSGFLAFADFDWTDTHVVSVAYNAGASTFGQSLGTMNVVLNADTVQGNGGDISWSYQIDSALALQIGDLTRVVESFTVTVRDQFGAISTRDVAITLTPNTAPTTSSEGASGSMSATDSSTAGVIALQDPDALDTHTVTVSPTALQVGGTLTATVVSEAPTAETAKPLLLIVAGQSNAAGAGVVGQAVPSQLSQPLDGAKIYSTSAGFISYQAGVTSGSTVSPMAGAWGPEAEFARQFRLDHPDQPIYIVRVALGGTQLENTNVAAAGSNSRDWAPESNELFLNATTAVNGAKALLSQLGISDYNQALVWMQGESDAGNATTAANYRDNLRDLVSAARTSWLADDDAPVIIGRINAPGYNFRADVRSAQDVIGGAVVNTRVINTDSFPLASDGLHYTPSGQISFGAAAYSNWNTVETSTGNATGNIEWVYTPNATLARALGQGQTGLDTFTLTVSDGRSGQSTRVVSVTVTGVNDGPVAANDTATISEDSQASETGTVLVNDNDPDQLDTLAVVAVGGSATNLGAVLQGTYGALVLNANGTYTYTLTSELAQSINADQLVSDVFSYVISDSVGATATANLAITIVGANDAPLAQNDSVSTTEDAIAPLAGNVIANDRDVDQADLLTVTAVGGSVSNVGSSLTGSYGTLRLNADGAYSYSVDTLGLQSLSAADSVTDSFTYTVTDSHGASANTTLDFIIAGANDAPSATADTASVTQSIQPSVSGVTLSNDGDIENDALRLTGISAGGGDVQAVGVDAVAISGVYGVLTIDANGAYSYVLDARADRLGDGAAGVDSFTYFVADTFGATSSTTLTIQVIGTNDAPIAIADRSSVSQSIAPSASGSLTANDQDVDSDALLVTAVTPNGGTTQTLDSNDQTVTGAYGTLTVNSSGSYNYLLDTRADRLASGETVEESFTYTIADDHGGSSQSTFTVEIAGSNDAPLANDDEAVAGGDIQGFSIPTVLANDLDIDDGAVLMVSRADIDDTLDYAVTADGTIIAGLYGDLEIKGDGTYSYGVVNDRPAFRALAADATATDIFYYEITDDQGATDTAQLTLVVSGTNDAPLIDLSGPSDGANTDFLTTFTNAIAAPIAASDATAGDLDQNDTLVSLTVTLTNGYNVGKEQLTLTAAGTALLSAHGLTLTNNGPASLVISGNAEAVIYQDLLHEITYLNSESSFGLDMRPRGIDVAVIDSHGAAVNATTTLNAQANVSDTSGRNLFVGSSGADIIAGLGGNDRLEGEAGNDILRGGAGNDALFGGDGDDQFFVGVNESADSYDGGAGTDMITATAANMTIVMSSMTGIEAISSGGFGNVSVRGTAAVDIFDFSSTTLTGITQIDVANGNDVVTGSAGRDKIVGGGGNDTLYGGAENDVLNGGIGSDALYGGDGRDLILGGTGSDNLYGGAGPDTFDFNALNDSPLVGSDIVRDFQSGDRLDLATIDANTTIAGDQAFVFIGQASFSNVAGELRFDPGVSGFTQVLGDVNGDGAADFMIRLSGSLILNSADYIL